MSDDEDDGATRDERIKALKCYPCHICNKKFWRRGNLDKHVALHELGFDCYQCDDGDGRPQPHPSSAALAEHVRRFHPSDVTGRGADEPSAIFDPEWQIVQTHQSNSKKFQKVRTNYEVELRHSECVEPSFENFDTLFTTLLGQVGFLSREFLEVFLENFSRNSREISREFFLNFSRKNREFS